MPLNYDYRKVKVKTWEPDGTFDKDGEPLGEITQILNSLIWITMTVGMSSITEKNWKDFYTRMKLIKADRNLLRKDEDGNYTVPISAEEVRDHIGLMTNASTMTKAEFLKHAYEVASRETKRAAKAIEEVSK
jgi:hypothetical protein|tara:strand:+ start:43 stop:438 length:396 start_codon:yes stop_codon:yes gene_type:complete